MFKRRCLLQCDGAGRRFQGTGVGADQSCSWLRYSCRWVSLQVGDNAEGMGGGTYVPACQVCYRRGGCGVGAGRGAGMQQQWMRCDGCVTMKLCCWPPVYCLCTVIALQRTLPHPLLHLTAPPCLACCPQAARTEVAKAQEALAGSEERIRATEQVRGQLQQDATCSYPSPITSQGLEALVHTSAG